MRQKITSSVRVINGKVGGVNVSQATRLLFARDLILVERSSGIGHVPKSKNWLAGIKIFGLRRYSSLECKVKGIYNTERAGCVVLRCLPCSGFDLTKHIAWVREHVKPCKEKISI